MRDVIIIEVDKELNVQLELKCIVHNLKRYYLLVEQDIHNNSYRILSKMDIDSIDKIDNNGVLLVSKSVLRRTLGRYKILTEDLSNIIIEEAFNKRELLPDSNYNISEYDSELILDMLEVWIKANIDNSNVLDIKLYNKNFVAIKSVRYFKEILCELGFNGLAIDVLKLLKLNNKLICENNGNSHKYCKNINSTSCKDLDKQRRVVIINFNQDFADFIHKEKERFRDEQCSY